MRINIFIITLFLILSSCASSRKVNYSDKFYRAIRNENYSAASNILKYPNKEDEEIDVLDVNFSPTGEKTLVNSLRSKYAAFYDLYLECTIINEHKLTKECMDDGCDEEDSEDKAALLRKLEKKCGPGGALVDAAEALSAILKVNVLDRENDYAKAVKQEISEMEKNRNEAIQLEKSTAQERDNKEKERILKGVDIYTSACNARSGLIHFNSIIEREKEGGKISGYVNKSALHEAGLGIINYKNIQKQAEAEHLKRFGKPIDMEKCKCNNGFSGIDCKK